MNTAAAFSSFPCTAESGRPRPPPSIVYSRRRRYTAACDFAPQASHAEEKGPRGAAILLSRLAVTLGGSRKRRLGGGRSKSGAAVAKRGRDAAARPSPERMHGASPSRGGNAVQRQRRNERRWGRRAPAERVFLARCSGQRSVSSRRPCKY